MANITDLTELQELEDDDLIYVVRQDPVGDFRLRRAVLRQDIEEPASQARGYRDEAEGYRDQAREARDEIEGKTGYLEGTISVVGEGEDYVELQALQPADLVESTETLGDTVIEIVEITI